MAADDDTRRDAASRLLAARGVHGFVWLDDALRVAATEGSLAAFASPGTPVGQAIPALLGLEDQIRATYATPLVLANLGMATADRLAPRLSLRVFPRPDAAGFIVHLVEEAAGTGLEVMLAGQIRARAIAEADAADKSRRLAAANADLLQANQDLQAFARIIAHDVQAPLRALRFIAGDAAEAVSAGDAASAARHLAQVRDRSRRMAAMLSGLLAYASVGDKATAVEDVCLRSLIDEIVADQARPAGLEIVVDGAWPRLCTLVQPLDIVLRNLIDNAVKHHDRPQGRIVAAVADAGAMLAFTIADDGPGIHPAWQEAIFAPFRRIEDDEERARGVEGAGIGLALVKKTVDWFGGRIEVVSDPQVTRGTTFRVLWPRDVTGAGPGGTMPGSRE